MAMRSFGCLILLVLYSSSCVGEKLHSGPTLKEQHKEDKKIRLQAFDQQLRSEKPITSLFQLTMEVMENEDLQLTAQTIS